MSVFIQQRNTDIKLSANGGAARRGAAWLGFIAV
jgi:hypothetical protein